MKFSKVVLMAFALVLAVSTSASAAGFGIYEWSARGNAMGGAVVALPKDASTVASNPAAMTALEGTHAMFGVSLIQPYTEMDFSGASNDSKTKANVFTPPHLYLTYQGNEDLWFGLGLYSRFGLGTEWDKDWPGKNNVYEAAVQSLSFTPTIAFKPLDNLSVGIGADINYLEFKQNKITTAGAAVDAKLKADSVALGYNLSVFYEPLEWMNVGFIYRSEIDHNLSGTARFDGYNGGAPSALYPDQTVNGSLTLPASFTFALGFKPTDKWSIEGDVVWTQWSSYQTLTINYNTGLLGGAVTQTNTEKNWNNVYRFQLGTEYNLTENWDLRASYIFDQSPVPNETADYMLPTNNRQLYSVGAGWHNETWIVDGSYTYLASKQREYNGGVAGTLNGTAKNSSTHIVGFSVGYKF